MPEMSWLSPKRRRTTGNLRTMRNAQYNNSTDADGSAMPTRSGSWGSERPSPSSRSQSSVPVMYHGAPDGNLFYAYARRSDDLRSRYLLTFASASVANEWWSLTQSHLPECTRPGPQLFSFKTEDFLPKAWKHPAFEHLKTKWMYISFLDTGENGVGGAAMGVIPLQDESGNLLGGSAGPDVGEAVGLAREEVKGMRNEVGKLEEHFDQMMEVVERNTQGVKMLAEEKGDAEANHRTATGGGGGGGGGYFDMSELSAHFGRMFDLLTRNTEHAENMSKKQFENEQKLKDALGDVGVKQREDRLDMNKLSSHLDRIQGMMEQSLVERNDSARSSEQKAPVIDFSPLTQRLEKVQEAVEQNSTLVKALLDEGAAPDAEAKTPFWGRDASQPQQVDMSPLTEHLEKIYTAIEQQSSHMRALVSFASGEGEDGGQSPQQQANISLAPLGEHLEQIYNAIDEGNMQAKDDTKHLGAIHWSTDKNTSLLQQIRDTQNETTAALNKSQNSEVDLSPLKDHLERLVEEQQATREAVEANGGELDFSPLADHMEAVKEAIEGQHGPLLEHLQGIREATDSNAQRLKAFLDAQKDQTTSQAPAMDITPLTDRLKRIHTSLEKANSSSRSGSPSAGDPKFLLSALTSHLSKIQAVTEQNASAVKGLSQRNVEANEKRKVERDGSDKVQENFDKRLEATSSQVRELMAGQREMTKVMRELAQAITAQNKGSCDHIVIPPPRKVGRKIVGFVYDGKDEPV